MKAETLKKLQQADGVETETPEGFNWRENIIRVETLKTELENLTSISFEMDYGVQDASFFTDLSFKKPLNNFRHVDFVFTIRFSAFGNLFTIWFYCDYRDTPFSLIKQIIQITEGHGFIYVPADELEEPYTGLHEGFTKYGYSWWGRFFDYY